MSMKYVKRPSFALRNWPGWIGVVVIWTLGALPRRPTLALCEALGPLLHRLAGRRRRIAERNLSRCFPEWPAERVDAVTRAHFRCIGRMIAETAWSWSGNDARIDRLGEVRGLNHLERARDRGRGVLVVTAHLTCLEIGARIAARRVHGSGIYRPLGSEVIEWYQNRRRARFCKHMLSKRNLRAAVRMLRDGEVLWYAPDQDFGSQQSVFAPFFGIPAATLLATHRLPQMTRCAVVMMFPRYDRAERRYDVEFMPPLASFPSDDPVADLTRINALIEDHVRSCPEQYWWIHRRFKSRPPGEPPFYD